MNVSVDVAVYNEVYVKSGGASTSAQPWKRDSQSAWHPCTSERDPGSDAICQVRQVFAPCESQGAHVAAVIAPSIFPRGTRLLLILEFLSSIREKHKNIKGLLA